MQREKVLQNIQLLFKGLEKPSAANAFPRLGHLTQTLNAIVGDDKAGHKNINNDELRYFATGSVEMWHRSLHSFFISASLTKASPIWSSVAGYYSSHYIMRAFAHLLGYYQLFNKKVFIALDLDSSGYSFKITKGGDREHKLYWKLVKDSNLFPGNPFFYYNDDIPPVNTKSEFRSDGGHRNRANYSDHVGNFPVFQILDSEYLKTRIHQISNIELSDVPIPVVDNFPDIDSVQVIAYHRIVRYRKLLDEALTSKNRFWEINRNPSWKPSYFDFQIVDPAYMSLYS